MNSVSWFIFKAEAVRSVADDATKALHIWIKKQIEPATKEQK